MYRHWTGVKYSENKTPFETWIDMEPRYID